MKRFNNIVYILNNETSTLTPSFTQAINLAKTNQAKLTLLQIHPSVKSANLTNLTGLSESLIKEKVQTKELDRLNALIQPLKQELEIAIDIRFGKKYIEAIQAVHDKQFDLVIKEATKVDWLDRFLGSDDMHLLRKCPCPVWMMSGNEKTAYKNIVVALDFKDEFEDCDREKNYEFNMTLLELSSVLALSEMAVLHVVNVYNVPNAGFVSLWVEQPDKVEQQLFDSEYKNRQRQMNTIMEGLKQRLGKETFKYIMPRPHIIQGYPDQELPKFANKTEADLMVMGTVARSGVAGVIIGNTAETILSQLNCAILAVKPSDFVSPILNKISPL